MTLNQALSRINTIPNINYGGCGFVAKNVTLAMRRLGQRANPILHSSSPSSVISHCITNNSTDFRRDHLSCYIERIGYMDSEGILSKERIESYSSKTIIPMNFLEFILQNPFLWNRDFDRDNVKQIEEICNKITSI